MLSRRKFVGTGLAALAVGLSSRRGLCGLMAAAGRAPKDLAAPLAPITLPRSIMVEGMPFASEGWSGDVWNYDTMPFHHGENRYPNDQPPAASESTDIVIVGGGLSGLAAAYLLRRHHPVVFELADRFGGVARGETWNGLPYSLGSAYFINPDEGSDLQRFYCELGFDQTHRLSEGDGPVELNGELIESIFDDPGIPPAEREALQRYRNLVQEFVEDYPEIPLVGEPEEHAWVVELDRVSFRQHVEGRIGPVPPLLASLIQGYFYSSFGAGWEEISAAAGWNFVAAEEFGRWVLPGGNAGLVEALYQKLRAQSTRPDRDVSRDAAPKPARANLRQGRRVVEVREAGPGRLLVVTSDGQGHFDALHARRVVLACPKHVARLVIKPLVEEPHPWVQASRQVYTYAYLVVNLLLDRPLNRDFYDLFLLWNGQYPMDTPSVEQWHRITDVVNGVYNRVHTDGRSVLTCYWPLPYPAARFPLFDETSFTDYARSAAPRIRHLLAALGLPEHALVQARLARWGHAFPIARVGFLAGGAWKTLREPPYPGVFAIGQDNWVLPAVETCLLEAMAMIPRIEEGL
ncbi:MAG: FAD-dependent oxidoreductase [Phycisphaerales bacterium]